MTMTTEQAEWFSGTFEKLVANVERASYRGVLGINIGKNFDTPLERAAAFQRWVSQPDAPGAP